VTKRRRSVRAIVLPVALALLAAAAARAQEADAPPSLEGPGDGAAVYRDACQSCHGADGRGRAGLGVQVPLPDFTDCSFNTREPTSDWSFVVAHGGTAMGLDAAMPAFDGALTPEQIEAALEHVRSFCAEAGWPRGELNFRRPIFTTKAFPENELVALQEFTKGPGANARWRTRLFYEARIGSRGQAEVAIPFIVEDPSQGATVGGAGDVAVSYKHVLWDSLERLAILSGQLELVVPTGDRDRGLGDGTLSFEPSLLYGQHLAPLVVQAQLQGLAPVDEGRADRGLRVRTALSLPLGPLRRDWWPTLELEAEENVTRDESTFFLTPQVYKAIRKRGHVALAVGVQVPVGGRRPFEYRVVGFLLWEYLDGGLWW
jgi:mono/diheme cytochrome c family protein